MPCTTILVGKKVSFDGSTIIARNDDGGFEPKGTIVIDSNKAPRKYKSVISKVEIELPDFSYRYTSHVNIDKNHRGLWPVGGINEFNVAMNATETITSNPLVFGGDPLVEKKKEKGKTIPGGIGEEDLVALVLPYVKTAREGIIRLGELHEKYGTYERNGIAISDENEIWWFESIGGHHFMAVRVPDDKMVIMPNQLGIDNFDLNDGIGQQKNYICSKDLKEFIEKNTLNLNLNQNFNPRLVFGSHTDQDHIYNTPRAWFMGRYFLERTYKWNGENADFTPESNDIPWSFVSERKVSIEDIRYLLGSYYQGTPYNPYDSTASQKGKYRTIGVPNSDVCGIMQIRGYLPEAIQGVEWLSLGGSGFTACFPVYSNVEEFPAYISKTTDTVSTEHMYWQSRLIAALTDATYNSSILLDERYQNAVWNQGHKLLYEYDAKFISGEDYAMLKEANQKITDMVKKESDTALGNILKNASEHMTIRYHRGDN